MLSSVNSPAAMDAYKPSALRFLALGIFGFGSFLSAVMWISFAPIPDLVAAALGVNEAGVNTIALLFMIVYLPASVLAMWMTERYGLRATLLFGIGMDALGTCMKWAGFYAGDTRTAYAVVLTGQILGSIGQPSILNVPARLSMDWFPQSERDVATIVATMSNVVGQMCGSLLPAYLVSDMLSLKAFTLSQFIANGALFVIAAFLLPERAPTAPSAAAAQQWKAREASGGRDQAMLALQQMLSDTKALFWSRNFVLLFFGFSIATGMAWTLLTLQAQVIQPCNYDSSIVGNSAASLLGIGVAVSFIVGPIMQRTKMFALLFKLFLLLSLGMAIFALGVNQPNQSGLVMGAWALLGGSVQPVLPIALECAAELTYPVAADTSSSMLLIGANVLGIMLTYVLTALLQLPPSANCTTALTPAAYFVCGFLALGLLVSLPMRQESKRQAAEAKGRGHSGHELGLSIDADPLLTRVHA